MKIKEVMLKPVFVYPNDTKKKILSKVKRNPNTSLFVVATRNKQFLGDIHENDLFFMLTPNEMVNEVGLELAFDLKKKFFAKKAKDLMREHDLSCSPEDELIDVAKKFIQAEVNEMPVLKKGKVVGVINQGILLRQLKIK
ncbi:CBS domain-containing protein [Candidatus Woesearchaeota archaeon]|nr:CBS domain-containing protein [Candidatus Woesearchaeota archaeon]